MTCFFSVKKRDRQHGPSTCFLLAQSTGLGQRSAQPHPIPIPIHMWPVSLPSSLETSPVWSGRESLRVADLPATNRPETAHGPSPNPSHVPIPPPVSALPLNVYAQQSRSRQGLPIRLVWLQPKASLHRLFPPIKAPVRHPLPPALWLSSLPCSAPLFPFPVSSCLRFVSVAFLFRFRVDLVPGRSYGRPCSFCSV
jgi:hypothetical protein